MKRTDVVIQEAIVAAGARACALGLGWSAPSRFRVAMAHNGAATTRPLGRLPD
jgi:hypothetical protein